MFHAIIGYVDHRKGFGMSKFNELVGLARGEGFTVTPEYLDSLVSEHELALAGVTDAAAGDAEIWTQERLEFEAALQERDAVISQLKSKNYDLLTQVPAAPAVSDNNDNDNDNDGDDPDIDDLFE